MFVAPPGYQPVYGPCIPYLGPIYGGLREGVSIYIQGSIPEDITRFYINLLCGESEASDIAMHFNPRFDGWDKVVFNSCQGGCWESEEKIRSMPFCKGELFEMVIIVTIEGYQIIVNGNDFYTFAHRLPMERVCAMQIAGDVSVQTINVIGGGFPGANLPVRQSCHPIPYSNMIPGGMFPKRTLIIRGMVPYGADRMSINFMVSRCRDIAFHMNPRVREGIVVRNSMLGGSWGQEERELGMCPFMEGQYFDFSVFTSQMSIRCGNQRFKVFVNGQHLFDFFHRFQSFSEIDLLEIEGDIQISYIHF
uniref:Galectin n=1 Tax=Acanthochromis polyacanthus TaxID=80966 RepID=A0A3Q1F598_9TELE